MVPTSPGDAADGASADGEAGRAAALTAGSGFDALYATLHAIAGRLLAGERKDHTLQATALLHEAWLRLSGRDAAWADADQFVRAAAVCMRRALVDHARARAADRRGGAHVRVELSPELLGSDTSPGEVVAVDEALSRLAELDPELVQVVELRVFGGLSHPAIARVLGSSLRTVERQWRVARAFLVHELGSRPSGQPAVGSP